MKLLADMNVSMTTVRSLREWGHDAIHLRDKGWERLSDAAVIEQARSEGRIIITFDLDFGDLMAAGNEALPSVIIFRLSDTSPAHVSERLGNILNLKETELRDGAIVIVEDRRYRTRALPLFQIIDD